MKDVAARAGVSHQTVSRVVKGAPYVAPRTRARVLAAIEELGYRPNLAARALVTGKTDAIGVIAQSTALYGPSSTVAALGEVAASAGMSLSVSYVPDFHKSSVLEALARLADQRVGGIVVIAPEDSATEVLADVPAELPLVTVDGPAGLPTGNVALDQFTGARLATDHLLAAGHATVWHIAGPATWHGAVARERGWRAALEDAGKDVPPVLRAEWSAVSGHAAGCLLARIPEATAVFAASDAIALGAMRALVEAGRRVPYDVSIVGFDDIPEAGYLLPPLTTVRQEFAELGRIALDVLVAAMNEELPRSQLVEPCLIERRSVTTPPLT